MALAGLLISHEPQCVVAGRTKARIAVLIDESEPTSSAGMPALRSLPGDGGPREAGEQVGPTNPLIVDEWGNYRMAGNPVIAAIITSKTLRDQLARLYVKIGLRNGKAGRRHQFQRVHSFRKFFKSVAERHMKSIYVELLMGHSTGVSDSYMKPSQEEMAQEYAKAIPALTVLSREEVTQGDVENARKEAALDAMKAMAATFGIDPMKVRIEKKKERGRELTKEEEMELMTVEIKKLREEPKRNPQMLVKEEELQSYLADGWHFVSVLPSQRMLVRKAAGGFSVK